jgi:hypothetical protein
LIGRNRLYDEFTARNSRHRHLGPVEGEVHQLGNLRVVEDVFVPLAQAIQTDVPNQLSLAFEALGRIGQPRALQKAQADAARRQNE